MEASANERLLDRIDEIVVRTALLAQAEVLRGLASMMRSGLNITPESLEVAAESVRRASERSGE